MAAAAGCGGTATCSRRRNRRMTCSFSKIVIFLLLSLASFFVLKILSGVRYAAEAAQQQAGPDVQAAAAETQADRKLNSLQASSGNEEKEKGYIEVLKERPQASYSSKIAFDKILEKSRQRHNRPGGGFPIGGTGFPLAGNAAGLSHLKQSLKDPGFVRRMKDMESKRQDLYVTILDKRGQLVTKPDGSKTIVSYPQIPVRIPNNLKRNMADYSSKELIWLNITHFPWPMDEDCRRYSVTFGRNLSIVGLASYPSSGNTWLRYLIEGITGYYSGSMYNDLTLRQRGFYGEGMAADSGLVMTVKTHGHTTDKGSHVRREEQYKYNHQDEVNRTAILLIRNPFAAIMGHRNLDQGGHTGMAKPEDFIGDGWDNFVRIKIESWLNFYSDWLETSKPENILVIHYENIKLNLRHSLRRILDFLNLEEDEGRLHCTVEHNTGLFKRDHQKIVQEDPFTEEQRELIREAIHTLNAKLRQARKESLPTHLYKYYNSP